MFFKLALKNIKRSFKDYAIYFFTLVLGVAIFYVFNAIESQTAMLGISKSLYDIVDMMTTILSVVSVFVAFVLGFLILYASRFLIKRRSKEFGLYLTLGMGKRKVSRVLLLETFIIGLVSLVVGLLLGVVLSQLTSIIVANLFEADLTQFTFVFSASACIKTLICFGIIYLIVMIFNTININRQKLINLLTNGQRSEKIKNKNPWVCTIVFVVAVLMLAWAYYAVTAGVEEFLMAEEYMIWLILLAGALATFLLFWSLSGLLLRIFMSCKQVYYHKLNSFTLRQFSSKINTTVFSMTTICLMLFVTICVFSSAMSIRNSMNATAKANLPVDVEFEEAYRVTNHEDGSTTVTTVAGIANEAELEELDEKQGILSVIDFYQSKGVDFSDLMATYAAYTTYTLPSWSLQDSLGAAYSELKAEFPAIYYDRSETLMTESDYNGLAELFGNEKVSLGKDEYVVIANYPSMVEMRNRGLATNPTIKVFGQTLKPKYDHCLDGKYELSSTANDNAGLIIVPDNFKFSGEKYTLSRLVAKYNDKYDRREVDQILEETWDEAIHNERVSFWVQTRSGIIDNSVGLGAMVTFIGLYLGMIFLVASAAVLALKELSESSDNRQKFSMLRKIGASEKMLNTALFWQIAIFFGFPLLIAIIHSIFGLIFCSFVLEAFGGMDLFQSILLTAALIVVIYGGYFLITYTCSKNIIREHRV